MQTYIAGKPRVSRALCAAVVDIYKIDEYTRQIQTFNPFAAEDCNRLNKQDFKFLKEKV